MLLPLEEYLERRGAKHFIAALMFFYVIGTLIFNIYLLHLGISDFDFLQLRYMFSGFIFALITFGIYLFFRITIFLIKFILSPFTEKDESEEEKTSSNADLSHRKKPKNSLLEIFLYGLLACWTPVYAVYIFPQIPANFGGAKPVLARFIGNTEDIKDINSIIELETNAENLPLEQVDKAGKLAIGANVKILDRNQDRIWIMLTKDLYLSSKSHLAQKLVQAGEEEILKNLQKDFFEKPLFIDASAVKSISFSLYIPPAITTKDDIRLAAEVLAQANKSNKSPGENQKTLEVVEENFIESFDKNSQKISHIITEIKTQKNQDPESIEEIIINSIDEEFLEFRAYIFSQALIIRDQERFHGTKLPERQKLVQEILESLWEKFYIGKSQLPIYNFLTQHTDDPFFPEKIVQTFQGAPDIETIVTRIKALEPTPEKPEDYTDAPLSLDKENSDEEASQEESQAVGAQEIEPIPEISNLENPEQTTGSGTTQK